MGEKGNEAPRNLLTEVNNAKKYQQIGTAQLSTIGTKGRYKRLNKSL